MGWIVDSIWPVIRFAVTISIDALVCLMSSCTTSYGIAFTIAVSSRSNAAPRSASPDRLAAIIASDTWPMVSRAASLSSSALACASSASASS